MAKQTLSIEQMLHLNRLISLNRETDFIWWGKGEGTDPDKYKWELYCADTADANPECDWVYPAYTLQDVLDALPGSIKHKDFRYYLVYNKSEGFIGYYVVEFDGNHRYARYEEFYNGIDGLSVIDAAYELLVWCIDNKFVETNKNE